MTLISRKKQTTNLDPQLQSATENLQQPFKFIATVLFVYLPRMPRFVQGIVVIVFLVLIVLLCIGALKQFGGIDLFALANKNDNYYQVAGEVVLRNQFRWEPSSSGIEFTSTKLLFTRKEIMQAGYFRLTWIIKFPENELGSGAIDLSITEKDSAGIYRDIASALKSYSTLFDPSHPYRWVRLVADTAQTSDRLQVEFVD